MKTLISVRFNANLTFQHGHPILTITLPSRNQPVAFTCKPVTGTVGSLINDIIKEDGGVHQADIRTEVCIGGITLDCIIWVWVDTH